jgi:hypothetical protein
MISLQPDHLMLTVVAGESRSRERRLAWGVAAPPLSIGAAAEWEVRGAGIEDVHVHLSFDGRRLRAAVASPAAMARVHDAELDTVWRELRVPFELAFGSARIAGHVVGAAPACASVGARKGAQPSTDATRDGALEGRKETGFLDLQTINLAAALIPRATLSVGVLPTPLATLPSSERAEAERRCYSRSLPASAFQIASGSTLSWSLGSLRVPPPRPRANPPGAPRARAPREPSGPLRASLDTLCDGGALRQYAQTLEARVATRANPVSPTADVRACPRAAQSFVGALERVWRRASNNLASVPNGRRWAAVPAATALLLTGWAALPAPGSAEGGSAAMTMSPPGALEAGGRARSLDDAAPMHTDGSGESRVAPLAPATGDPTKPREPAPPLGAPALGAPALRAPRPSAAAAEPTAAGTLELDAFRAAFGGDIAQADALYRQLARQRNAPLFEHAARALRDSRVHKP